MILELAIAATNHMSEGDFNERHLAIRLSEANYFVTAYHNSEDTLSLGVGYKLENNGFFAEGAVVTGYEYAPVLPMIRGGYETGNFRVWVAPSVDRSGNLFGIIGAEIYFTVGE